MKLLPLFTLTAILLSSCARDQSIDDKLLEKAEEAYRTTSTTKYDEYMGDYAPETEYSAGDVSNIDGIYYYFGYYSSLADGKYFFDVNTFQTVTHADGSASKGTATTTQSIDLETGESFYLCPDPLCKHPKGICKYTGLNCIGYYDGNLYYRKLATDDDGFYRTVIEQLDIATGTFSPVYEVAEEFDTDRREHLTLAKVVNSKLFYNITTAYVNSETKTETQNTVRYVIDLDSGETEVLPDQNCLILYVSEDCVYGYSYDCGCIIRMNSEYSNPFRISAPEGFLNFGDMQIDENTGEVFVLMMGESGKYGVLCKLVGNRLEELSMPHENITKFQLTRDTIYYSAYDPVELGKSTRDDTAVTVDGGGKIYKTDRSTRSEAELIFSAGVDFDMQSWFVLGDNLYFDSVLRVEEGERVYFSSARSLKHVRINLLNHTARYFRFD